MSEQPELYVKVCSKCGRQVQPHVDHNLGASRTVYCDHGRGGVGTMEQVGWERIEVVPVHQGQERGELEGHRVEVEFNGDSLWSSLIHPENGCKPPVDEESGEEIEGEDCWITGWFDEHQADLLHGKVTLAVTEEWDGDSARLFVNDRQFASSQPVLDVEGPLQKAASDFLDASQRIERSGDAGEMEEYEECWHELAAALSDLEGRDGGGGSDV